LNKNNYYLLEREKIDTLNYLDFNETKKKIDNDVKRSLLKKFNINLDENTKTQKDGVVSVRSIIPLILQPQNTITSKHELFF
jgi:hypothetical protein